MSSLAVSSLVLLLTTSGADEAVDFDDLIEKARANARRSEEAILDYTFVAHEQSVVTKPNGKVVERSDRKYRVVPVPGGVIRELLSVDGREPNAKERKKNEKRNRKGLEERAKQEAKRESDAEDDDQVSDGLATMVELLSRTDSEVVGRKQRDGRELIGIAFEPSVVEGEKGLTKKMLKHLRGTVWLDTETADPVVVEMGNADKFRVKGVVGIKDLSFRFEQIRVHDELWLPSVVEAAGLVSLLGMKRHFESTTTLSEHLKAVVTVEEGGYVAADHELEDLLAAEESTTPP